MKAEVHWIDGKMVSATLGKAEGKLQIERWASTFAADSYSFSGYQATGNDRPFLHVKGKFTRVKAAPAAAAATAGLGKAKSFGPVPEEMAVLTKGAGTYRIKGWMIMDPSMPKTDIGATEVIGSVFGGAGVEFALSGDPIPGMGKYEGWGMIAWNAEEKCYKHLWLDNMGMAKIVDGHHRNGALIMINASLMMGQPIANRSVLKFDAAGNFASLEEHRLLGELPPMHCFSATYARQ
jgi:hypothetical protein